MRGNSVVSSAHMIISGKFLIGFLGKKLGLTLFYLFLLYLPWLPFFFLLVFISRVYVA